MRRNLAILIASLAASPAAGDLRLGLPVECSLGTDCFIQQGVDHDVTAGFSDFQCGSLTYDGHKGTDFAVPFLNDLEDDISVVAAASGNIVGVRDGMPDALQVGDNAPDITGRECGNGVVIDHGNGWQTQYCHLALGSVSVAPGDMVQSGDALGTIGLSGLTQFPHLDFSVRRDDRVIDPFDPDGQITCGEDSEQTLWDAPIEMPPGGVISSGFASEIPEYSLIKQGDAASDIISDDQPLVIWGYLFGGRPGDTIHLRIFGPDGHVMDESTALEKTQAQLFRAVGRKPPAGGWRPGTYIGEVQMIREGAVLDVSQAMVSVR